MGRLILFILGLLPRYVIASPEDEPYLVRYTLLWTPWLRLYLHNILVSDRDREPHDHPWGFTSLILRRGYLEHLPGGPRRRRPGNLIRHKAEDLHRIELVDGPAWTLVLCGRKTREWGFQTDEGWMPWREYLSRR